MKVAVSEDIGRLLSQRVPLIALESAQEPYVLELLQKLCTEKRQTLYYWTLSDGMETLGFGPRMANAGESMGATEVLKAIKERNQGGVFVLCDFHPHWDNEPLNVRLLKDIALNFDNIEKHIVLLSHRLDTPPELAPYIAHAKLTLPTDDEILTIVRQEAQRYVRNSEQKRIKTDSRALEQLVKNLRGLTHHDVARLAYHAIADDGVIDATDIPQVNSAKFSLLNQQGLLSYQFDTETMANVGGLHNFKHWLQERRRAFDGDNNLPTPKGVLLLGVQGGGKSLAAKAVAGLWGLPLLRLDMGGLYNKFIGETEKNLRDSLQQAETMSPCVLWLDELEKAMAGGNSDDGVSKRLLGYFLTWLAEHRSQVFLVATSNDISKLPAELVRKGRFDEIFFVDLPDTDVLKDIFTIHLKKRGICHEAMDLSRVVAAAEGFSGAEVEQAVVSALYAANEGDDITEDDLIQAIFKTTPLSVVMAEQIHTLRNWASGRTVLA